MTPDNLILRPLRLEDEDEFLLAIDEFAEVNPDWEFALSFDREKSFSEYVQMHDEWSRGINLPEGIVPGSFLVGIVNGKIVGRLSLRHRLNEYLERIGGHIGFGVVPRYRNRGYAAEILRQSLSICKTLGISKALITCDTDNVGSRKVIENCGGVFDGITDYPELTIQKRRYWIKIFDS